VRFAVYVPWAVCFAKVVVLTALLLGAAVENAQPNWVLGLPAANVLVSFVMHLEHKNVKEKCVELTNVPAGMAVKLKVPVVTAGLP
jgi:hypothetical protein